jgi:hypothetical protein
MRIMFEIDHPAHVHNFRFTIQHLLAEGNEIKIVAKEKDLSIRLLDRYELPFEKIGVSSAGFTGKALGLIETDYRLLKIAKKFKPDLLVSRGSPYSAFVSRIVKKPHIAFCDTEFAWLGWLLAYPFTDVICTPACFRKDLGSKHVRYNGYKELAYLHPKYFHPEPAVLDEQGLDPQDRFFIVRFIAWNAYHDYKLKGIEESKKVDFLRSLEKFGRVIVTAEGKMHRNLDRYRVKVSPEKIHSLLYYSHLYIGEGGTMAAEAAVLGTPAIHIEATSSGQATGDSSGNFLELRDRYQLLYFYPSQDPAMAKAIEILEDRNSKKEWQRRRGELLQEKIDVTAWMTDFINRYPDSFTGYRKISG